MNLLQKTLNSSLDSESKSANIPNWLPNGIKTYVGQSVQIRILYGADILNCFVARAAWTDEEVHHEDEKYKVSAHFPLPIQKRLKKC